jgi:KEOPS complex subunit Cgi121
MDVWNMIDLPEFGKVLFLLGFRDVHIASIDAFLPQLRRVASIPLQVFDAAVIAGQQHLLFATLNALTAFEQGQRISENLAVEILLYASGQRQISKAIELIGVKPTTVTIAVAFLTATPDDAETVEAKLTQVIPGVRDDRVLEFQAGKVERVINAFAVTDRELEAVADDAEKPWGALVKIVIERGALLAIDR